MLFWHGISRLNEESDDNLKLFVDKLKMFNVVDIKHVEYTVYMYHQIVTKSNA